MGSEAISAAVDVTPISTATPAILERRKTTLSDAA
jgi:hypothetical protein